MAPFDGRVIARNLTKGEVAEITEKLFVVADLSRVGLAVFRKKISPSFIRSVLRGQSVEVLVDTYPGHVFPRRATTSATRPIPRPDHAPPPETPNPEQEL